MTITQIKNHLRVFKLCFVKSPGSLLGLSIASILTVLFALLYNLYSGKVIDSALGIASSNGEFTIILIPLAIYIGLLFFTSISESIKTYFDVLYNNAIDLIGAAIGSRIGL